jgi:protoporphyrinogen oxidase
MDKPISLSEEDDVQADYDAIIFGSGVSGLVSAAILLEQGLSKIAVVDEYTHIGGNHIDISIGEYTFDVGSFLFQDNSDLLKYFPGLLPLYVPVKASTARITPRGTVTKYPFSFKDELLKAGPLEWGRVALSLGFSRLFRRRIRNAQDYGEYWISSRLMKLSGLRYFMERFYGVPPEKIDNQFAQSRMRWIRDNASVRKNIARLLKWPARQPVRQQQLVRPREGFDYLYRAAAKQLENQGAEFYLGEQLKSLQRQSKIFVLQTGSSRLKAKRVISTIPLTRMMDLCGLAHNDEVRTVTLLTLFYSFQGDRGFVRNILYNFSAAGAWKRLTMHSDFYGRCNGREFFSVEANASHVDGSIEAADLDFRKHIEQVALFAGDLRLEGSHVLRNAYPIYVKHSSERAAEAIGALRRLGIESFGRQGGFDYQPTAQVSIQAARAALTPPSTAEA